MHILHLLSCHDPSVIEVYPAATIAGRNIPRADCEGKEGQERQKCLIDWREDIICRLGDEMWLSEDEIKNRSILENAHVFDAMLCTLAASDFATGKAISPEDAAINGVKIGLKIAKKEGWIWVKNR